MSQEIAYNFLLQSRNSCFHFVLFAIIYNIKINIRLPSTYYFSNYLFTILPAACVYWDPAISPRIPESEMDYTCEFCE